MILSARFNVGQNLGLTKSKRDNPPKEKEFRKQIKIWFSEYEKFKYGPIFTIEELQKIGHYTQVNTGSLASNLLIF